MMALNSLFRRFALIFLQSHKRSSCILHKRGCCSLLVLSESAVQPKRDCTFDFNPKMLNGKGDDEDDKIAGLKS